MAPILGLPYVLHVHDYDYAADYMGRSPFMQARVRRMFSRARNVLVLGNRDRATLSDLFQLPPGRAVILHNAVPDPLSEGLREARDGPSHILFLGYLSARKGVPELLQALASAELTSRLWRATLAGSGPIEAYRAEAARLGVADRISFPGWLDQGAASTMCADADILVLPSHAEGLAMAVLEGLSHGLAVVTTAVGAHDEVIEPDVSGILVPPGNVAALAAALARVIDDDELRTRLQRGARARYLAGFDIRLYCSRLLQLHEGLVSHVGSPQSDGASHQAALR
jgi:glycosyltransferase involved in cell wall biosynthesis